jgi:SWI/SNF-related matrix-associated actin-dependent regulator of chromatin subfamily A member 5
VASSPSSLASSSIPSSPSKRQSRAVIDDEETESAEEIVATRLLQQPSCIKFGQMRPYQLEGLNWMIKLQEHGVNGILADEMGLGKTLQSISILGFMQEYKNISGPHLVLVPKSTLSNWMNEFARWCPSLRTVRFHGDKDERQRIVRNVLKPGVPQSEREWDVVVTTYEICNMEASALAKFAWRYMVIDEAHRIKNEESKFSRTIRTLKTEHRLLITGTPLQNNLHELWALLNFMLPDIFESAEQFDELFNLQIDDDDEKKTMIGMLHKILRPFMLRRLKADVEKSLPPKSEMMIFTNMSTMQKELYKKILRREVDTVNGKQGASKNALMNIVMQLRKACNHPYLFEGQEDRSLDPLGDHLISNCGKMALLDKLLAKLKERGHRVLIFSQMTRMLDIIEDFMIMRNYQYCRIDGDTSYDDREELIDAYNAPGSEKFVFLLSTRAGGLGINLQTADTVVLYDSDWNPQSDLQAQDRAHRIGQKKIVNVYRLVTENTIEEKVVTRAQQKLKLDAMVVQQGRLANKDKLSKDELMDALRFGAEKVFRSGEEGVNDEDIDIILDRGKKRTEELMGKLENAEKGDLLDFKMDGGMKAQEFEGQDYSAERRRNTVPIIDKMLLLEEECSQQRIRKPVANYNEKNFYIHGESRDRPKKPKKPRSKLPDGLRIPHMHAWQFFEHERLNEIVTEEERLFLIRANSTVDILPETRL